MNDRKKGPYRVSQGAPQSVAGKLQNLGWQYSAGEPDKKNNPGPTTALPQSKTHRHLLKLQGKEGDTKVRGHLA